MLNPTPIPIPENTKEIIYYNTIICSMYCAACVVKCKWHITHAYNNSTLPLLIQVETTIYHYHYLSTRWLAAAALPSLYSHTWKYNRYNIL